MEIEAKFALPDAETYRDLLVVEHLAGFTLSAGRTRQMRDTYLDTADRAILEAGYACRRREQDEGILITLKQLGGVEGAIHRREELEVTLAADASPAEWPAGSARDRVFELIGEEPLSPLFALRQTRVIRQVSRDGRQVAELSLDEVRLVAWDTERVFFDLEVELAAQGAGDDLKAIAAYLQDEWGLVPEPWSKFERAHAFLEGVSPGGDLLTSYEYAVCLEVAEQDDVHARRARALLALDEGATQAEAGEHAGLTARQVSYWLARFREKRLGIFPDDALSWPAPEPAAPRSEVQPEPEPEAEPEPKAEVLSLPDAPGLEPDDTMAEAARKTLYFHFQQMLYHEPGTRLGGDPDELHDMRVSTRRMRAALQVFGDYLDMEQMAPFAKGLRRTGRALGAVRDMDVFWEKTQHYLDSLPPEQQGDLDPLRTVWEAEHEQARQRMLAYLDGDRYARFKGRFGEFLQTPGAGALPLISKKGQPLPRRLRHVVPVVVHQRLMAVRSYDEWVTATEVPLERLHRLRIAAKGLRYTLEFFQEVLGAEAGAVIDEIKGLQDHLGALQDAVVASDLLRGFLTWGTWGHIQTRASKVSLPVEPIVAPGVAAYLAARQTELQELLDTFPQVWTRIQNPEFSQGIAAALAVL
jgi:CHAD domain-containing protein/transposase-like protein